MNSLSLEALRAIEKWVGLSESELSSSSKEIRKLMHDGDQRGLIKALSIICPQEMWQWPEYDELAAHMSKAASRSQMLEMLAHKLWKTQYWQHRTAQMQEADGEGMYIKFMAVMDAQTPEECEDINGHCAPLADPFWFKNHPQVCRRVFCRCTVVMCDSASPT